MTIRLGPPGRRAALGLATAAATVGAVLPGTPTAAGTSTGDILAAGGVTAVADSYIVVLKDTAVESGVVADTAADLTRANGGTVVRTYRHALRGFEARMPEAAVRRLAADPKVAYVQQNHTVSIAGTQSPTPSWGLDRIDQRNLPLDSSFTYPNTGSGVKAYIIDTGIRFSHSDFGGRAVTGFDAIDGGSADDCNGHGTHVAGTVGGNAYGVAKTATLVGVRVLDCGGSGTYADVIAGVDWVTGDHAAGTPAVANMSLGGGSFQALNDAVDTSIADGVSYAIAAGNSNANACNYSPASTPNAITVGATDYSSDARANYSNWGTCLDIFAPGSVITSAWYTSDTAMNSISGTSMAAPHVAGAAALVLAANPTYTPQQVRDRLVADATDGLVANPGAGSPNELLYVGEESAPPPPAGCTGTNDTDVAVPDFNAPAVTSPITISGCSRAASAGATVEVHILHPNRGELEISLVAPDGTAYPLQSRNNDSGDDLHATYTVDLSAEAADGTWQLNVRDRRKNSTGTVDSWTLTV